MKPKKKKAIKPVRPANAVKDWKKEALQAIADRDKFARECEGWRRLYKAAKAFCSRLQRGDHGTAD